MEKELTQTEVLHMECRDTGEFAHRETTQYEQIETFNDEVVNEVAGNEEYVHLKSLDDEFHYMDSTMPPKPGAGDPAAAAAAPSSEEAEADQRQAQPDYPADCPEGRLDGAEDMTAADRPDHPQQHADSVILERYVDIQEADRLVHDTGPVQEAQLVPGDIDARPSLMQQSSSHLPLHEID